MTKVKDLIQKLAALGMETRVFICDEKGVKCNVGYTVGSSAKGIKLWPAKRGWNKAPK